VKTCETCGALLRRRWLQIIDIDGDPIYFCYHPDSEEDSPCLDEWETLCGRCTCGSGAHPRRCKAHSEAFAKHIQQLSEQSSKETERYRVETDE
jgi:hypothetical protein